MCLSTSSRRIASTIRRGIALSRKVKVVHDPAITALGAAHRHKVRVEVHFRDGSIERETREAPRGSEHSFAGADDIVGKFRKLTRGVMGKQQRGAHRCGDAARRVAGQPDAYRFAARCPNPAADDDSPNPGYSCRRITKWNSASSIISTAPGRRLPDYYEDRLKIVEAYDRAGFYAYHLAEHHATPLGMAPSPNVFLAALAQRTRRLRFGPMVFVLPLYHPLRLIEEICMLDQMSGGRLEIGFGRGASLIELAIFGEDPDAAQDIYTEGLELILKGLTRKRLDFHGKHFTFDAVPMELEPLQKPHPPIWYGVHAPDSAERAAKRNLHVVSLDPPADTRLVDRTLSRHLAAAASGRRAAQARPRPLHRCRRYRCRGVALARRAYPIWHQSFTYLFRSARPARKSSRAGRASGTDGEAWCQTG